MFQEYILSIDIDLTYILMKIEKKASKMINAHLMELKQMIEKAIPDIKVVPKLVVWKLHCSKDGAIVKLN